MKAHFTVNGEPHDVDIRGPESLLTVLRRDLELAGTKDACEQGECGSCSVRMDDEIVCSCLVLAADAHGAEITTVEGLGSDDDLHPVQQAMVEHGAVQCGFCTPGFVVAAAHLLEHNPRPSELEIREALSGNVCRCTGYGAILRSLQALAEESP